MTQVIAEMFMNLLQYLVDSLERLSFLGTQSHVIKLNYIVSFIAITIITL